MYHEGDASQSEGFKVSLGSLHGTQHEAFFVGADIVLPIAVQRAHAAREKERESEGKGRRYFNIIFRAVAFKWIAIVFLPSILAPVRSQLIGGHSNKRRAGSSLTDGNLHPLKLRRHFAREEKTRAPDNVDQPPRTGLCGENPSALAYLNAQCEDLFHVWGETRLQWWWPRPQEDRITAPWRRGSLWSSLQLCRWTVTHQHRDSAVFSTSWVSKNSFYCWMRGQWVALMRWALTWPSGKTHNGRALWAHRLSPGWEGPRRGLLRPLRRRGARVPAAAVRFHAAAARVSVPRGSAGDPAPAPARSLSMILEKRKQCRGEGEDLRLFVCSSKNASGARKNPRYLMVMVTSRRLSVVMTPLMWCRTAVRVRMLGAELLDSD